VREEKRLNHQHDPDLALKRREGCDLKNAWGVLKGKHAQPRSTYGEARRLGGEQEGDSLPKGEMRGYRFTSGDYGSVRQWDGGE